MKSRILLLCSLLLPLMPVNAEVVSASDTFFHIKISDDVKVTPEVAYKQLLNIGEWWSSDHTWFGDAKNMYLEVRAGGCFCEKSEMGEVMHMQVTGVYPNAQIRMTGGLGPLQELGLHGAMTWKFVANEHGGTTITHEYRVNGGGVDDLPGLAEIVNKVQTLQVSLLVKKLSE